MAHRGETLHKDVCCIADLKKMGSSRLAPMVRDYYNGGAMDLITLNENEAAYDRYKIRPRILVNVDKIDTTTEFLGSNVSLPFGFSPAASMKLAHPDGELATSRAAAKYGLCMGLSSYSNYPLEDVAAQGAGNPYVMQMCVLRDRSITLQLLERAEKAGYKALFLSVDVPVLGKRINEYRNEYTIPDDMSWPNILSHGADHSNRTEYDPSLDWEETIPWLKQNTSLKIWLKGVTSPEDIELAIKYDVDGVVISNHGGRQLDGVPSTLDALRVCAPVAKNRIPIAVDGGIRRGSDIFKALALGASFCFIGRIPFWGLAYNGQEGVELAIRILRQELRITMALAGCRTISEIQKCYLSVLQPDGILSKL
ncbi:Aldolase-type TIM barrel [Penicillium expansum]|uniref:Oxidase FUB9 n=1 Tax=Penicillium expansum TaxID=27334 RepID=A0A0A2JCD0_PENEN|nr:Aldolase-type TIM barrel [Penicillium expansum]KGO40213.1 Aldolase-type TIM barrel [Penicillium expansum]KGO53024.1 Aldolase-type TIM barrel [Penicillium expansum]KGO69784.1 Aldolase-type TIM barrel [Penicillium expansum]